MYHRNRPVKALMPCMLISPINVALKNYYQGVRRVRLSELTAFLECFLMPVLFAFLLSRFWQITDTRIQIFRVFRSFKLRNPLPQSSGKINPEKHFIGHGNFEPAGSSS